MSASEFPTDLDPGDLIFLPLGGVGEIGMNCALYGWQGKWLMVDCGMTFADEAAPGVDLLFPDVSFIAERRKDLVGIVLTHGHEDHIGAIAHLWEQLRVPVYTSPFCAALLESKFKEKGLLEMVTVRKFSADSARKIGPFTVEPKRISHSIAEGHGLVIRTDHGAVYHSGDWKLDPSGPTGVIDPETSLAPLGHDRVLALISDSTNIFNKQASGTEESVYEGLLEVVQAASGRVVVTTFASNVARIANIARVARATGREFCIAGRSLERITAAARSCGYLVDLPPLLDPAYASDVPPERLLLLTTGCQGEPRAGMARIARGEHRDFKLDPGDTVIFSSKMIPGNEIEIGRLQNQLAGRGVEIVTEKDAPIHVSGHPGQPEVKTLMQWLKPRKVVPVHGEMRHLQRHARFAAEQQGVEQTIVITNGDALRLAPGDLEVVGTAPVGRHALDGEEMVSLDDDALQDRRRILVQGYAACILIVDGDEYLGEPELITRGLPGLTDPESALFDDLVDAIAFAVENLGSPERRSDDQISEAVRIATRRFCRAQIGKNPVVDTRVIRLESEEA